MTKHALADQKHLAFQLLVQSGFTKVKAAELLGYSKSMAGKIDKKCEKKRIKIDLASEIYLRPAVEAVQKLSTGQKVGKMKAVKGSEVLAAANVFIDRAFPKKSETAPPVLTFTQINLSAYETPGTRSRPPECDDENPAIDVTPSTTTLKVRPDEDA